MLRRVLRRAALVFLVLVLAGCTGTHRLPAPVHSAALDPAVLERWARWPGSALPAEPVERADCAADPGSDRWFLGAPVSTGVGMSYECAMPSGRPLVVVVAASSVGTSGLSCSVPYLDKLGYTGTVRVDGYPLALVWTGPVTGGPQPLCVLWGITGPLAAGGHKVVLTAQVRGESGNATAQITAR
jgi:hypothetical protein